MSDTTTPGAIITSAPTTRRYGRTVDFEWEIGPGTDAVTDEPVTVYAVLSCSSRHPGRKACVAMLSKQSGDGNVRIYDPLSGVRIDKTDSPRYSAKALDAFASGALAVLRSRVGEPAIRAFFSLK